MTRRNPVRWLMTDERMGDELWGALQAVPPGSGVVFRQHATPPGPRRTMLRRVERIAAARRLVLLVAGGGSGKAGAHGSASGRSDGLRSGSAHDRREARHAIRAGATLLFVSPVHATRSHPGASPTGPLAAARIGAGLGVTIIALGGMNERRWRRIRGLGFDGWAAIDAWVDRASRQKRNTVPT